MDGVFSSETLLFELRIVLTADEARILDNFLLVLFFGTEIGESVDDDTKDEVQNDDDDDEEEDHVVDDSGREERLLSMGTMELEGVTNDLTCKCS